MDTAYDNILSFSNISKFNEYRRSLIVDKGTIANGKLPVSMVLTYQSVVSRPALFETETGSEHIPKELLLAGASSKRLPGLLFRKESFDEIIRQVVSRQEISLESLKDGFLFAKSTDESAWDNLSNEKTRLIARNLALLNKETATNYRIYGERLHYLTIGKVRVRFMRQDYEEDAHYPLFLFACEEVDERNLKVKVDTSGFVNFWLDKNRFDDYFYKKWHHYEIDLNSDLTYTLNNIATEINNMHFIDFDIQLDPSYIGVQIITGFEAEYIDSAWNKILGEEEK